MDNFKCEKCGACCAAVECEHLKNNRCEIYENRPILCRVDKMYKVRGLKISKQKYYEINKSFCEILRRERDARTN